MINCARDVAMDTRRVSVWCGRGPNSECDEVRETDRQKETRTRAKETNERERLRGERRESERE